MGYDTKIGQTNQNQKGEVFDYSSIQGATSQGQQGAVFDGFTVVDGPAGPPGPPGPVGPTVDITASATAQAGALPAVTVTTSSPSTGVENIEFNFTLPQGGQGNAGTVAVGTVTANKLAPNANPTVVVNDVGTPSNGILNFIFGIPQGASGDLSVGTVTTTTGAAGTQASVTITEEAANPGTYDFAFVIPQGIQGPAGPTGPQGPQGDPGTAATIAAGTATSLAPGATPTVTNSGTSSAAVFNFGIPQGAQGNTGPAGRGIATITAVAGTPTSTALPVTFTETFSDSSTPATQTIDIPLANQILSGSNDPTSAVTSVAYPSLYIQTTANTLWGRVSAAANWVQISGGGGGSGLTNITSTDGTLSVTINGSTADLKIAQQTANSGNYLTWNGTKWAPHTLTHDLTSSGNTMSLTIDGNTPDSAPIVNEFTNLSNPVQNQVSFRVNGVTTDQEPIIDPAGFSNNGLAFNTTTRNLVATINGVQSNVVNIPNPPTPPEGVTQIIAGTNVTISPVGGTGVVTVNATAQGTLTNVVETSNAGFMSFGSTTANGVVTVRETWNSQNANYILAGLNFIAIDTVWTGPLTFVTANKDTTFGIDTLFNGSNSILGMNNATSITITAGTNFSSAITQLFSTPGFSSRWVVSFNPNASTAHFGYNGTVSPFPLGTGGNQFSLGFNFIPADWDNENQINARTSTVSQQLGGTPQFRQPNPDDILPMIAGTPVDMQVPVWNAANNSATWGPAGSITTVAKGAGINVVDAPVGNNHAYTVSAALTAQDNTVSIAGTYSAINLGTNLSGSVTNGILTINSTGGGGGSVSAASEWTSGGTNKDAYSSPGTVNNQGITIYLTASTNVGQVTAATVSLNGTAIAGKTYASTGTFPNYTLAIPAADLTGLAAETANTVDVSINGMYDAAQTIITAGTLTNTQPIPANVTFNAFGQTLTIRSIFATPGTGTITSSLSNSSGGGTSGVMYALDGGTAQASGTFTGVAVGAHTVRATGNANGTHGAPLNVAFNLTANASITQNTYIPFFFITENTVRTQPTFDTTTGQVGTTGWTSGQRVTGGSGVTPATGSLWIALDSTTGSHTFKAVALGQEYPLSVDVSASQTISGRTYNVYGFYNPQPNATIAIY